MHLKDAIDNKNGKFHIPPRKNGTPRISEQELKYSFVETFINEAADGYSYSVETQTDYKYRFTQKGKRVKPKCLGKNSKEGRCGNIDVVLHKGEEKVALIEFKANNADEFEHAKDICKLEHEPGEGLLRFFVEIFESTDDDTLQNLEKKLFHNNEYGNNASIASFVGYSLHHKETNSCVKIMGNNKKQNVSIDKSTLCVK